VPWLVLRVPARKSAALAAIFGALGYTLLAGFAVPAQRTFYMVTVVALALWSGRITSPVRTLALALAAVVAADPWAPLSPGLWLSFGAVALIFYVAAKDKNTLVQWARIQWAITVGLAPAALLLFGQISVAGPLANALAIPLVSGVVTPLALAAAVLPFEPLLRLAAWLVEWLLQFLEWCAALPGALWQQHEPLPWTVAAALLGVAWLLAPRGTPWRAGGLALFLPAFLLLPPGPQACHHVRHVPMELGSRGFPYTALPGVPGILVHSLPCRLVERQSLVHAGHGIVVADYSLVMLRIDE
jgi:competence protein ComEC